MSQHAIDLLPESVRARCQAGMRTGQCIGTLVIMTGLIVVLTTHARLGLNTAREALKVAEANSNLVLVAEGRATELQAELAELNEQIETYARMAHPLEISRVVATIANQLPGSITLDSLEIDAAPHRAASSPRSKAGTSEPQDLPRLLTGEIGGFAATDHHIAELVTRLERTEPFREVSLDYSRSRAVRERSAREFRLSFQIDLERMYLDAEDALESLPTTTKPATNAMEISPHAHD